MVWTVSASQPLNTWIIKHWFCLLSPKDKAQIQAATGFTNLRSFQSDRIAWKSSDRQIGPFLVPAGNLCKAELQLPRNQDSEAFMDESCTNCNPYLSYRIFICQTSGQDFEVHMIPPFIPIVHTFRFSTRILCSLEVTIGETSCYRGGRQGTVFSPWWLQLKSVIRTITLIETVEVSSISH